MSRCGRTLDDDPDMTDASSQRSASVEQSAPVGQQRPLRLTAASGEVRYRFKRGRERPRGVAWFGIRSFWGHLRHLVASAIATEDVDSRDWMTADEPHALAERVARLLGGTGKGNTLSERLGRDLWIDYLADTGDDVAVSRAVAKLVVREYELPDPANASRSVLAPRGEVLFFGGDTAYPVATADEIQNRVVVPFNEVFAERDDGRRRVLLGIPGNHDWYDGLDGFGRLFRRHVDYGSEGRPVPTLHGSSRTLLEHAGQFAKEFVRGGSIGKPHTLDLVGYTAVQSASYFALPIAPTISLLAVDRQLKQVDARQQRFFSSWLNAHLAVAPWVVLPDPVYAFGLPSPTGTAAVEALGLTLSARPHLVMAGDIHHYRREVDGPTLHITAGGGGAFLHPGVVTRRTGRAALVEWPNGAQSRALLGQVPLKVALGRSGILPHLFLIALLLPAYLNWGAWVRVTISAAFAAIAIGLALVLIGGLRRHVLPRILLAIPAACAILGIPLGLHQLLLIFLTGVAPDWLSGLVSLLLGIPLGVAGFGLYLAAMTALGYENLQAFTALDHPGFKHFLRLRVRFDGSGIDGWCIGKVDPLNAQEDPVLVDTFSWDCQHRN